MLFKENKVLTEFNIKDLKFLKTKFYPERGLERSKINLGFCSFLYSKLLGELVDQKNGIGAYFVKSLNVNYLEFSKKLKSSRSLDSFQLKDFKSPYLGLIFYKKSPETIVDAEEILMGYFANLLNKYVLPQKPMLPFSFYNYFGYFSPEDLKKIKQSDLKKLIKSTSNPSYNGGKVDLSTVFISNYLVSNLEKEFNLAKKEIKKLGRKPKKNQTKETEKNEI